MGNLYLVYLFVLSSFIKCSNVNGSLSCEDCHDKGCVSQQVHKIAKKKLGKEVDSYNIKVEEDGDFFVFSYINKEYRDNPMKKGGDEIMIKISKKDCRVIEYKRFK